MFVTIHAHRAHVNTCQQQNAVRLDFGPGVDTRGNARRLYLAHLERHKHFYYSIMVSDCDCDGDGERGRGRAHSSCERACVIKYCARHAHANKARAHKDRYLGARTHAVVFCSPKSVTLMRARAFSWVKAHARVWAGTARLRSASAGHGHGGVRSNGTISTINRTF